MQILRYTILLIYARAHECENAFWRSICEVSTAGITMWKLRSKGIKGASKWTGHEEMTKKNESPRVCKNTKHINVVAIWNLLNVTMLHICNCVILKWGFLLNFVLDRTLHTFQHRPLQRCGTKRPCSVKFIDTRWSGNKLSCIVQKIGPLGRQ